MISKARVTAYTVFFSRTVVLKLEPLVKRFVADAAITAALAFFAEVVFAGVAGAADTDLCRWLVADMTAKFCILNGRGARGVRSFAGDSRGGWLKGMVHMLSRRLSKRLRWLRADHSLSRAFAEPATRSAGEFRFENLQAFFESLQAMFQDGVNDRFGSSRLRAGNRWISKLPLQCREHKQRVLVAVCFGDAAFL